MSAGTIIVDAASVTKLRSGDHLLLLRTNLGAARLLVPQAAAGIFRATNPHHEGTSKPAPVAGKPEAKQP